MSAERLHFLGWLGGAAMFVAGAAAAGPDYQSVVGSKHDLSADPAIAGSADACGFCHEVESASGRILPGLNRPPPLATFALYESATLAGEITELGSASLHCLSCHDGITPFDAVGDSPGTPGNNMGTIFPQSPAIIGTDLSGHHPVGALLPGNEAFAEAAAITTSGLALYQGRVECPTCHEVHGKGGFGSFLRADLAGAALCQTCHVK